MIVPEQTMGDKSTPAASKRAQTLVHEPSQRRIVFDFANERGEIEVRTEDGALELRITLTESGPVLSVSAARIELSATETVAVRCRNFEVETTESMRLRSAGPIEVKAAGDLRLDGDQVFLNCEEGFRGGR